MLKYTNITEESLNFLEDLLSTNSPSGLEMQAARCFYKYVSQWGESHIDILGNTTVSLLRNSETKIMLCAHYDEIGLRITHIDSYGLLRFRGIGGIDINSLAGMSVIIINKNGTEISGVIGKHPIHICQEKRALEINDLWIDIGADSNEDAKQKVSIGDSATFSPNLKFLTSHRIMSKGIDDKIGVFVVAEAIRILSQKELMVNVYGVASTQEEVGSKGAAVAASAISPNIGICIDVGLSTDIPNVSENKYGIFHLSNGPGINHSTDSNISLVKLITSVCEEKAIKHQHTTGLIETGGTDTVKLQTTLNGAATALINIPSRYMHTPVEVCDLRDIDSTISLLVETVIEISNNPQTSFIPY